jgi:3-hydroxyisobutyrate dehydrogenase
MALASDFMASVAFFGLGAMGSGMAARLISAGHQVTVWNRNEHKCAAFQSEHPTVRVAATPADAAVSCRFAVSMVADDQASTEVWQGEHGALDALAPGSVLIECSTLSRARVAELSAQAAAHGVRYVDAPVTGLPDAAAAGQLTILAGGDPADLAEAQQILGTFSSTTLHFGSVGSGTDYKLMINLMGAVQIAAAAEGLRMAAAAGLDLDLVGRALATSQAASPQVVRNVARMIAGNHDTEIVFSGRLRLKDARYGVQAARALGVEPRFGDVAVEQLTRLVDAGLGECNESKIYDITAPVLPAPGSTGPERTKDPA